MSVSQKTTNCFIIMGTTTLILWEIDIAAMRKKREGLLYLNVRICDEFTPHNVASTDLDLDRFSDQTTGC
jgi:hypothetical protein